MSNDIKNIKYPDLKSKKCVKCFDKWATHYGICLPKKPCQDNNKKLISEKTLNYWMELKFLKEITTERLRIIEKELYEHDHIIIKYNYGFCCNICGQKWPYCNNKNKSPDTCYMKHEVDQDAKGYYVTDLYKNRYYIDNYDKDHFNSYECIFCETDYSNDF
jgi:hypothetical protein